MKRLILSALAIFAASCGSQNALPTPSLPVATTTRIINVFGDMNYANVWLNGRKTNTLTIQNLGNAPLTPEPVDFFRRDLP